MPAQCRTCNSAYREQIDAYLRQGRNPTEIARALPEDADLGMRNVAEHHKRGHSARPVVSPTLNRFIQVKVVSTDSGALDMKPMPRQSQGDPVQRARHRRRMYGIGVEDQHRLMERQGGLCAICTTAPAVHLDHDHDTGEVRGFLCAPCNNGLGMLGDSVESLRRALAYLEAPPAKGLPRVHEGMK